MDELSALGIKYGTDKIGKHNYLPVYYDLFKDRRESIKKVLEIGPAEGAGIFMFRDFFPNATIYGMEIEQERTNRLQGKDRIQVYQGDQTNNMDLYALIKNTGRDIDIVIDDGSHKPKDQVFTCWQLLALLDKGVTYIIEDVAIKNTFYILDKLEKYYPQLLTLSKRYDDQLIICRK